MCTVHSYMYLVFLLLLFSKKKMCKSSFSTAFTTKLTGFYFVRIVSGPLISKFWTHPILFCPQNIKKYVLLS